MKILAFRPDTLSETKICYLDPKMRQTELEAIIKSAVIMGV